MIHVHYLKRIRELSPADPGRAPKPAFKYICVDTVTFTVHVTGEAGFVIKQVDSRRTYHPSGFTDASKTLTTDLEAMELMPTDYRGNQYLHLSAEGHDAGISLYLASDGRVGDWTMYEVGSTSRPSDVPFIWKGRALILFPMGAERPLNEEKWINVKPTPDHRMHEYVSKHP